MNEHRRRKMTVLLKSLGIPQAGFHAFRHFNVSLLDAQRVPLKTIQKRAGHALTGVFTLDVYGGQPEWERNLEAGRLAGWEIEKAVSKLENERSSASSWQLIGYYRKKARECPLLSLVVLISSLVAGACNAPNLLVIHFVIPWRHSLKRLEPRSLHSS
jgi:hypothetical protein